MIFYYSATGNSKAVANGLARRLKDNACSIIDTQADQLSDFTETVGIVFPIYAWGPAPAILSFVKENAGVLRGKRIWCVCTCGDEAGMGMRLMRKLMRKIEVEEPFLCASVIMPNTYVLLPGFDVDSTEIEARKLSAVSSRLDMLSDAIKDKKDMYDVREGSLPFFRTHPVYGLFRKQGFRLAKWQADDNCIGCGKCARVCPAGCIEMSDGKPNWNPGCLSCCACYHICPQKAVQSGSVTKGKGQYLFPPKLEL